MQRFKYLNASSSRFFIGYWILKTRLGFYPASIFLERSSLFKFGTVFYNYLHFPAENPGKLLSIQIIYFYLHKLLFKWLIILIIDDEKAIRKTLTEILSFEGYKIEEAADGEEGIKKFKEKTFDLVLCDIKMPKMDGIEFLQKAGEINPDVPIIMISGHGNIETAVEAVKKGAYDYISKPPDLNRLLITIRNAMDKSTLVTETKVLKRRVSKVQEMIGESSPIKKIKETIEKVAPTDARILITGENGVGKELVARWIHEKSNRVYRPHC